MLKLYVGIIFIRSDQNIGCPFKQDFTGEYKNSMPTITLNQLKVFVYDFGHLGANL